MGESVHADGGTCYHCKCEKCGKLIHLHCDELDGLQSHIRGEHGFEINSMRTVFYGLCDACRLGAEKTPCIRVYNKCDAYAGRLPGGEDEVCISARTGEGTSTLLYAIGQKLGGDLTRMRLCIPYEHTALVERLRREANVLELEYLEDGVRLLAVLRPDLRARVAPFEEGTDG